MKKRNDKQVKESLRRAFAAVTPPGDIDAILERCAQGEQLSVALPEKQTVFRTWRRIGAPAVAALLLLVCGALGGYAYDANCRVDTTVSIDVNPSIEIKANQRERVLEVNALNADGEQVIGTLAFKGTPLETAVNTLVDAMIAEGYLSPGDSTILVTIENKSEARAAAVESKLSAALAETKVDVAAQTVKRDETLEALATQYGVSVGKAKYVMDVIAENPARTFAELVNLDVRTLYVLKTEDHYSDEIPIGTEDFVGSLTDAEIAASAYAYIEQHNALNRVPFDRDTVQYFEAVPVLYLDEPRYSVSIENETHYYHLYVRMTDGGASHYSCANWRYGETMSEKNKEALLARAAADCGVDLSMIPRDRVEISFEDLRVGRAVDEELVYLSFHDTTSSLYDGKTKRYIYCFGVRSGEIYLRKEANDLSVEGLPVPAPQFDAQGYLTEASAVEIVLASLGLNHDTAHVVYTSLWLYSGIPESQWEVVLYDRSMSWRYTAVVGRETGKYYGDLLKKVNCVSYVDLKDLNLWEKEENIYLGANTAATCERRALRRALIDADLSLSDITVTQSKYTMLERHICWQYEFDAKGQHYCYYFDLSDNFAIYRKIVTPLAS